MGILPQIIFATFVGFIFSYITLEYSVFWAIGLHIFNNLVLGDGLALLYSYLPGVLVGLVHVILLYGGSGLALYFLYSLRKEISVYIKTNKPERGKLSFSFYGCLVLALYDFHDWKCDIYAISLIV